jgi:hypothetical protein
MSNCDKDNWFSAYQQIPAKDFTSNNLADIIAENASWQNSVTFRLTTDTNADASILDIHDFANSMWVEYQIEVPETGNYSLSLRYTTLANTGMFIVSTEEPRKPKH